MKLKPSSSVFSRVFLKKTLTPSPAASTQSAHRRARPSGHQQQTAVAPSHLHDDLLLLIAKLKFI
ncbi:hypothetical protein ACS0TY_000417 [Phlomoides rotata]